jgi:hypothetical protein
MIAVHIVDVLAQADPPTREFLPPISELAGSHKKSSLLFGIPLSVLKLVSNDTAAMRQHPGSILT